MAGANRSMLQLIKELRDDYSVEPFVLLPYGNDEKFSLKEFLEKENINYKELNIPYFKQETRLRRCRIHFYEVLREIDKELPTLQSLNFDLVHSNSSVIDFGGYISRKLEVKHVWHIREFGEADYYLHSIWGKLYEVLTYRNGDAFIAISNSIKTYFEGKISSSKIHVIYNGVKPKEKIPISQHTHSVVKFLCAGIICDSKNQMEILKAINILIHKRTLTSFHLYIVGREDPDYLSKLLDYIQQNNLDSYVSIIGEVDGIEAMASSMDVGIMSSRNEAFGRVTIEYMLMNLAVIANNRGANTEIIKDGDTGLIYKYENPDSLADKMQTFIENRNILIKLANNGKIEAENRFLSKQNTSLVYNLYKQVLSTPLKKSERINFSFWLLRLLHTKDLLVNIIK